MESLKNCALGALIIGYFIMGFVQIYATYSFFHDYWGWYSFFSVIASFIVGYMPLLGSIAGFFGALHIWHWEWWQAGLLFFWWPVFMGVVLICGGTITGAVTIKEKFFSRRNSIRYHATPVAAEVPSGTPENEVHVISSPKNQKPKKSLMSHISDSWYGRKPLWFTYWVIGAVGSLVLIMAIRGIEYLVLTNHFDPLFLYPYFFFVAFYLLYRGFIIGSIFRSAGNYTGPKVWKYLAQIMAILGAFGLVREVTEILTAFGLF